jgi:hypothetical protein
VTLKIDDGATIGDWVSHFSDESVQCPCGIDYMTQYWTLFLSPSSTYKVTDPVVNKNWLLATRTTNPKYWQAITDRVTQQAYFLPILIDDNFIFSNPKKVQVAKGVTFASDLREILTPAK